MKRLIPAAVVLVIIVIFMVMTQPAPQTEQFVIPIEIERPYFPNETAEKPIEEDVRMKGIRISNELDAAIAEYYQIIFSLKHEQDPVLQEKIAKYHDQWLDENAMKFYNYRYFIETNFQRIQELGLNPAEMLEDVNNDIKIMEQNRRALQWNGGNSSVF